MQYQHNNIIDSMFYFQVLPKTYRQKLFLHYNRLHILK